MKQRQSALACWLTHHFGARNIFYISIVLCSPGPLRCALAGSLNQLVLARVPKAFSKPAARGRARGAR